VASPECVSAASCRAAPAIQPTIFGSPSSATFFGLGNITGATVGLTPKTKAKPLTRKQQLAKALKVCKKRRGAKRHACEARAREQFATVKKATSSVKRAGNKQGAGR
jgi:hypothetical protein